MSFGRLNTRIEVVRPMRTTDSEGFGVSADVVLANVAAYREDKNATERWTNNAVFADASALFRFRRIPGVTVDNSCGIISDGERFDIVSTEDVRRRGMYIEVFAKRR